MSFKLKFPQSYAQDSKPTTLEYGLYLQYIFAYCIFASNFNIMLINELSKRTGVTVHTIRFYEKSGLIKGKQLEGVKSNNYFHYDEEAVERLNLIKGAKSIGFTINEMSRLIDAWYNEQFTKEEKLAICDEKLASIADKIEALEQMQTLLNQLKENIVSSNC
ncbi:MAG: MerR family transcriptional regulator [Saprospiraceae bacterium]|nr:MerR family transcriptional regulator [Saprospiraceae bacterium]